MPAPTRYGLSNDAEWMLVCHERLLHRRPEGTRLRQDAASGSASCGLFLAQRGVHWRRGSESPEEDHKSGSLLLRIISFYSL